MSLNHVALSGNLTRDPELRSTTSGLAILSFSIAVNDRRQQQDGSWVDVPNYVDCVVLGNRATGLSRFLSKGTKVAVTGKLRYSSWEKDGVKRSKLDVTVDNLEFLSRSGERPQETGQQSYQAAAPAPSAPMQQSRPAQPTTYGTGSYGASVPPAPVQSLQPQPAQQAYQTEVPPLGQPVVQADPQNMGSSDSGDPIPF